MKRSRSLLTFILLVLGLSASVPLAAQVDDRAQAYFLYCLGRMQEMEMRLEEAKASYRAAIQKDPESAYLHLALAELFAKSQETEQSVKSVQKAIELDGELAAAHRLLGKLYFGLIRGGGDEGAAEVAIGAFEKAVALDPSDVESRMSLAQLRLMRGENDEASAHLQELIAYAPDSYYALFLLAQVKSQEGDHAGAIELLRRSIEVEPRNQRAWSLLGALYKETGELEAAVSIFRRALEQNPEELGIRLQMADVLRRTGSFEEAVSGYEGILEVDPENVEAALGLAQTRQEMGEVAAAETLLRQALEKNPGHIPARYALARLYEESGEPAKAVAELEKLLSLPAQAYSLERRVEFLAHLGFARQELDDTPGALEAFRIARDLAKSDPRFHALLIQALLEAERTEEAGEASEKALEAFPGETSLLILEAQIDEARGKDDAALAALEKLYEERPGEEMVANALVGALTRHQRYTDAERILAGLVESAPENGQAWFQLGAVLERQKKHAEAEQAFQKVLALDPKHAPALNYLGYMLADLGVRLEESLGYIERAVALEPTNGAYLDSLGWVHFKLGNLDLAEENLLKAIERLRLTGVVYDHLGDLYYRKGKRDKAIEYWQKALEQEDEELEKEEVHRKIEQALAGQ